MIRQSSVHLKYNLILYLMLHKLCIIIYFLLILYQPKNEYLETCFSYLSFFVWTRCDVFWLSHSSFIKLTYETIPFGQIFTSGHWQIVVYTIDSPMVRTGLGKGPDRPDPGFRVKVSVFSGFSGAGYDEIFSGSKISEPGHCPLPSPRS